MTAAKGLFAKGGQPSIGQIAASAGVSRPTFYRIFPSRSQLLEALALEPAPSSRQRVLEAALDLLRTHTLADLSMEELAERAGLSRAGLYRLFPGKQELLREILLTYSPFKPVMATLEEAEQAEPDELIPALVRTAYRTVAGRPGIVRTLIYEGTSMNPSMRAALRETELTAFARVAAYLQRQMEAGKLRPMSPVLALQGLVGAVIMHLLSTPLLGELPQAPPSGEGAVIQLAENWLRGMKP
jgi:AcrR family transcriptional regulator